MKIFRVAMGLLAICSMLLVFCTKSDPFGSELFEDQLADFGFTDTFTLRATVVMEDSVNMLNTSKYLCGSLNDPIFGKTQAIVNTLFRLSRTGQDFKGAVADQAILYIGYDAANFYGDTTAEQTLEIWRLKDSISPSKAYFSNKTAETTVKIGELKFFPHPRTEQKLRDSTGITTQSDSLGAFLKVPIDLAFATEILGLDSASLATDEAFYKEINGLQFRVTTPGGSPCMMSFDLDNTNFSRLTLNYHIDTLKKQYNLTFRANKWVNFVHDYNGSAAGAALQNPSASDTLMFVQGAAGLKMKIEVPNIQKLKGAIINKAELELSVLTPVLSNDNSTLFPAASQLVLTEKVDTTFSYTSDVTYSLGTNLSGGFTNFGGTKKTENGFVKYRLNLSEHLQRMIEGTKSNTIYLNIYPQDMTVARAVLVGPNAVSSLRAKLNVKFTKL